MNPDEKILTLSRPFELASLNEAWKAASQDAVKEDKKNNQPAQEVAAPHAIQVSNLVLHKLPEILKIKDERSEEDKLSNTNPYKFKEIEVKYVAFLEANQMKFITDANARTNVILEFYGEKGENFS